MIMAQCIDCHKWFSYTEEEVNTMEYGNLQEVVCKDCTGDDGTIFIFLPPS